MAAAAALPSSSSTKICFNPACKQSKIGPLHKGWPLRSGDFAQLCDSCSLVYEEGRYCEVFHGKADGWRLCESCKKPLHCGCIASINAFVLLDRGGVECITCITKHFMRPSKQSSSHVLSLPSERFKNISTNNWNPVAVPNEKSDKWWHSANTRSIITSQSEMYSRIPYEVDHTNSIDSRIEVDRSIVSSFKGVHGDPSERVSPNCLDQFDKISGLNMVVALHAARREDKMFNSLHDSRHLLGDNKPMDARKGVLADRLKASAGMSFDTPTNTCMNISLQSASAKDPSVPESGMVVPYAPYNKTNDSARLSLTQPQLQTTQSPLSKQFHADSQNGLGAYAERQVRNGKGRGDSRVRNQLLPRYCPKISDQELQEISGDSKMLITPLFEKILSASDAGRIGRLVLPKKCAEAYFPTIVSPEGLPLRVQDAKGKEWQFQFRFWPNNNSRMYVLEGVTPCIQDMQLQAGDTVTFSRLDPDGKLVMGFRKTSNAPPSNQDKKLKIGNGVAKHGEANFKEANTWSEADRSGYIAKDAIVPSKRKSSVLSLKSKRLHIDNDELIDLQLTWEEAQGLLRPAHNLVPIVVVIEGHSFEEYEEPPILGKPTILPTKNLRSSCEVQEITDNRHQALLNSSNNVGLKKNKAAKKDSDTVEGLEGLDTLANLALLGEALPSTAQPPTTTKHPRHRPGCTCIVCIQPPSGKGPKHSDKCECNVCLTVKRRFRTLMERRAKRPAENELGTGKKKQPKQVDDLAASSNTSCGIHLATASAADDNNRQNPSSPFLGGIDLNIQPDREDESSPVSGSGGIMKILQEHAEVDKMAVSGTNRGLEQQVSSCGDGSENGNGVSRSCGQEEGDTDQPVPLSMWIPGTSATG